MLKLQTDPREKIHLKKVMTKNKIFVLFLSCFGCIICFTTIIFISIKYRSFDTHHDLFQDKLLFHFTSCFCTFCAYFRTNILNAPYEIFLSFANLIWILPLHCPKDNRFSGIEHEMLHRKIDTGRNISCSISFSPTFHVKLWKFELLFGQCTCRNGITNPEK